MARKESVTVQMLLETAFQMAREEGIASVTARKLAARANCSTQPIFRVYKNMNELIGDVNQKAYEYFQDFYSVYPKISKVPFVNLGLAYIAFSRKEGHLFELLFLNKEEEKKSMYEVLNGENGNVVYEFNMAEKTGCSNPGELFMKVWILIHGAACMSLTGDYDLTDVQTRNLLEESVNSFLK